ncbi:hypothetical protein roselon_02740 [Roseibacterium elongatum DSM 19469]|uniref:Uncharacterized protein n=1 Tax=Roseicyclus elongatus DSM 19469 TaxID=1294273 RepID=W8RV09_9RHOB|nr:hypothetical protein [Roseibacterium elongatum]AHM05039.1 hypothetical protein roselon_02740 [Roseibacterium elongatum DSM 19469]
MTRLVLSLVLSLGLPTLAAASGSPVAVGAGTPDPAAKLHDAAAPLPADALLALQGKKQIFDEALVLDADTAASGEGLKPAGADPVTPAPAL